MCCACSLEVTTLFKFLVQAKVYSYVTNQALTENQKTATSEGNCVTLKQAKHHEVGARSNLAVSFTGNCATVTQAQNGSSKVGRWSGLAGSPASVMEKVSVGQCF